MEISKVILGQKKMVDRLLVPLLSNGHILLEGVPGLKEKTLQLVHSTNQLICFDLQFTPDLLPADILGTQIYSPKSLIFSIKKDLFSLILFL